MSVGSAASLSLLLLDAEPDACADECQDRHTRRHKCKSRRRAVVGETWINVRIHHGIITKTKWVEVKVEVKVKGEGEDEVEVNQVTQRMLLYITVVRHYLTLFANAIHSDWILVVACLHESGQ